MKKNQVLTLFILILLIFVGLTAFFLTQTFPQLGKFQEPIPEVDMPTVVPPPPPTFIIYLHSQGKISYEIVGKQEATEIPFDQLHALLKTHQEEESNVALEVRPAQDLDYKTLREYVTEIGTMGIENYRLVGVGEEK